MKVCLQCQKTFSGKTSLCEDCLGDGRKISAKLAEEKSEKERKVQQKTQEKNFIAVSMLCGILLLMLFHNTVARVGVGLFLPTAIVSGVIGMVVAKQTS